LSALLFSRWISIIIILIAGVILYVSFKNGGETRELIRPVVGVYPQPTATPTQKVAESKTGLVSYYCEGFEGNKTANGDIYDCRAFTTAHRLLSFGTRVRLTYGVKSVEVVVNDRGPFIAGREFDLSKAAFEALAPVSKGILKVKYEVL
jgi:rare lipoprotein A